MGKKQIFLNTCSGDEVYKSQSHTYQYKCVDIVKRVETKKFYGNKNTLKHPLIWVSRVFSSMVSWKTSAMYRNFGMKMVRLETIKMKCLVRGKEISASIISVIGYSLSCFLFPFIW